MKWFLIEGHENQNNLEQFLQKTHKAIANPQNNQCVIIYHYIHTMKIIFIAHKF